MRSVTGLKTLKHSPKNYGKKHIIYYSIWEKEEEEEKTHSHLFSSALDVVTE